MPAPLPTSDEEWVAALPPEIAAAAAMYFSELTVVHTASDWLVAQVSARLGERPGRSVALARRRFVDLGAGAGKFCLAAAGRHPGADWVGVEHRAALLAEAERLRESYRLHNCRFDAGEIAGVALGGFDGAYAFNPFGELLDARPGLAPVGAVGLDAYRASRETLCAQLLDAPRGFALVGYYLAPGDVPTGAYHLLWRGEAGRLEGWIRA